MEIIDIIKKDEIPSPRNGEKKSKIRMKIEGSLKTLEPGEVTVVKVGKTHHINICRDIAKNMRIGTYEVKQRRQKNGDLYAYILRRS